uniref:Uncharacterized protein n=1 Tax=Anguilla anguilla TaxID=7936 RepID=A0A0E9TJB3_ANGAN
MEYRIIRCIFCVIMFWRFKA